MKTTMGTMQGIVLDASNYIFRHKNLKWKKLDNKRYLARNRVQGNPKQPLPLTKCIKKGAQPFQNTTRHIKE